MSYILSKTVFFYFGKWNFLALSLKNLYFMREFHKLEPLKKKRFEKIFCILSKKIPIFWKMELSNPKHQKLIFFLKKYFSYISGENLQDPKNKIFSYFGKWNFLTPSFKKLIFFQKKLLYLIFFIRIFFIRIFFIRIIRRNFYVISNKLKHLFFNNIFTFF